MVQLLYSNEGKNNFAKANQAQVFFVLTIVLFLIAISVAVIFGGVLAKETITQRAKVESVKADMLTSSALTDAVTQVQKNPAGSLTKTINLIQGQVVYTITNVNPTTTLINISNSVGRVTKKVLVQVNLDNDAVVQAIKVDF